MSAKKGKSKKQLLHLSSGFGIIRAYSEKLIEQDVIYIATLSIVVPCYNEEESLPFFYDEMIKVAALLPQLSLEMVFVDDGSADKTLDVLKGLFEKDKRVKYLSFSRNFGKEAALYAGLKHTTGDYVAVLDADLQDPPSLLPEMMGYIENEGYDCVATKRVSRKGEPVIRSFFAKVFYRIINKISKTDMVDGARDFRLMRREVVDAVLQMPEYNRFIKGIYSWVGFKTKWVTYENIERVAGKTTWSFWQLFIYSLEGILAFSVVPLAIASFIGLFLFFIALAAIILVIVRTAVWGDPVAGWPAMISIILFVGGIQLFCLGIIGQYLAKTYLETKKRPQFFVREKNF